jgi:hypothetical protein
MDIGYGTGTSPGGHKFALTLVDFCTRHTWTYGLKSKTAESVIEALWCSFIDAGDMPKCICCDFDASFVKGKVYKFLTQHQIKVTASPPHRQSQNGLVERHWQTAVRMARALLVEAQLPRCYWFWALREAVIRMNAMPCRPKGKHTTPPDTDSVDVLGVEVAQPAKANTCAPPKLPQTDLTTPFELFYGVKPDYRTLFK